MKQALVLGLALAANAMTADQVDNELIVAPQGKLGDLTKFPGKMGKIMFDDDELLIRPIVKADDDEFVAMLLPREHFKTEEEYQKYVAKMRFHRDDEELFVAPEGRLGELAKKYPGKIMFDAADDNELMVRLLPRENFKTEEEYQKYLAKWIFHRDDDELFVAPQGNLGEWAKKHPGRIMFDDDELLIRPIVKADDDEFIAMLLPREHFKTEEEYQKYVAKMRFHRDDEELFVAPEGRLGDLTKRYPGKIMFDEQADDELMVRLLPRESFQTEEEYQKYLAKWRSHRDDDELFVAPQGNLAELAKKYPGMIKFDEQADDELLLRYTTARTADGKSIQVRTRGCFESVSQYQKYLESKGVSRDVFTVKPTVAANDDELMVRLLPRESFQTEEEYQKYLAKWRFHRDDEELFVAPQGKLADLAKKYPGMIMFDEQADDELIAMIPPRDKFKSEEDYQRFVNRIKNSGSRDDADDELMVYYTKDSQGNRHYEGGYTIRRDEVADDELMVYYTKDSQGNRHYEGGYTVRRDDVADDELVQTFYSPSGADLVKYAKQFQQTVYRPTAHVVSRDAEADDELYSGAELVKYAKQSQQTVYRPTAHVVRDDEADDELMVYYTKDSQGNRHYEGGYTVRRDDVADDELVQTFYSPSGADLVKYAKQSQQTVYRPTAHVVRDDADDELAYLGHLIRETQPEKTEKKPERRHFRHEKN